jgi:hypothetical protein
MNTTANAADDTGTPRPRVVFGVIFGALLLVGNLLVLAAAWQDKSWGALVMAIVVGPILSGAFLVSGLVAIPFLKRRRVQFSLGRHLALTLGVPIAGVVADFFIIRWMGFHPC